MTLKNQCIQQHGEEDKTRRRKPENHQSEEATKRRTRMNKTKNTEKTIRQK